MWGKHCWRILQKSKSCLIWYKKFLDRLTGASSAELQANRDPKARYESLLPDFLTDADSPISRSFDNMFHADEASKQLAVKSHYTQRFQDLAATLNGMSLRLQPRENTDPNEGMWQVVSGEVLVANINVIAPNNDIAEVEYNVCMCVGGHPDAQPPSSGYVAYNRAVSFLEQHCASASIASLASNDIGAE